MINWIQKINLTLLTLLVMGFSWDSFASYSIERMEALGLPISVMAAVDGQESFQNDIHIMNQHSSDMYSRMFDHLNSPAKDKQLSYEEIESKQKKKLSQS